MGLTKFSEEEKCLKITCYIQTCHKNSLLKKKKKILPPHFEN